MAIPANRVTVEQSNQVNWKVTAFVLV
ncbi:MAG: hypothetical protein QOJ25_1476, partial [Solirubrobacteraceae bacterium]|nr:hypothetical protein [Solirubrobacteraceae bacterium]